MEVHPGALDTAAEAVDDLEGLLGSSLEVFDIGWTAVGCAFTVGGLVLWLSRGLFAVGLVDVASRERLGLGFRGRLCACGTIGGGALLSLDDLRAGTRLERLQSSGRVDCNAEVAGEGGSNVRRALLRVDLYDTLGENQN